MIRKLLVAALLTCSASWAGVPQPLWPGAPPGSHNAPKTETVVTGADGRRMVSHIAVPTLQAFPAARKSSAAVIVMSGGGFRVQMLDKEGTDVARRLSEHGIDAYVLKYRLPSEGHENPQFVPLQDVQRAIRLVRTAHPGQRIGVMGFSAGGNLAAAAAVHYRKTVYTPVDAVDAASARPDFFAMIYGVVPRADEIAKLGFAEGDGRAAFLQENLIEPAVTADTPPAFIVHGSADKHASAEHAVRLAEALAKTDVSCELHLFKGADHGFALDGKGEERAWPSLFVAWLKRGARMSVAQR